MTARCFCGTSRLERSACPPAGRQVCSVFPLLDSAQNAFATASGVSHIIQRVLPPPTDLAVLIPQSLQKTAARTRAIGLWLMGRQWLRDSTGKSGKQIEPRFVSTFQIAQRMGFKGEFRQWEHLLRIGD